MSNPNNMIKKKNGIGKILLAILVIIIACAIALVATVAIMMNSGKKKVLDETVSTEEITFIDGADVVDGGKTVTYNGKTYVLNEDVSSILFLGVDQVSYNEEDSEYGVGGQADSLFLTAIDNKTGKMTMIPISRNSMVEVDTYTKDGKFGGQKIMQITLAYAYGDGRESSCENVAAAASRLLFGMPINDYCAINLSAIGNLNDEIGGVTVTCLEDLTELDPELVQGETVTLHGIQAVTYVRSRDLEYTPGVDNNAVRMERQQQYIKAFVEQTVDKMKSEPMTPLHLFTAAKEDMITTLTASEVLHYASLVSENGLDTSIVNIPNEFRKGEYTEVYVDNDALYQIILDTFYNVQE